MNDAWALENTPLIVNTQISRSPTHVSIEAAEQFVKLLETLNSKKELYKNRRTLSSQEMNALRQEIYGNAAYLDLRSLPLIGEIFSSWLETELLDLETRVRIQALEMEIEAHQTRSEVNSMSSDLAIKINQIKQAQLVEHMDLYETDLSNKLKRLLMFQNQVILPLLHHVNPTIVSEFKESALQKYSSLSWNSPLHHVGKQIVRMAEDLSERADLFPQLTSQSVVTKTFAIVFPRNPNALYDSSRYILANQATSAELWSAISNGLNNSGKSSFTFKLTPDLLYVEGTGHRITRPVLESFGVGLIDPEMDNNNINNDNALPTVFSVKTGPTYYLDGGFKCSSLSYRRDFGSSLDEESLEKSTLSVGLCPIVVGQNFSLKDNALKAAQETSHRLYGDSPFTTYEFDFSHLHKDRTKFPKNSDFVLFIQIKGFR